MASSGVTGLKQAVQRTSVSGVAFTPTPPRRSAASTVLRSNMARVVGPTPPRRGVIQPATSAHASSTSGTTRRPSIVMPAPTTAAPGFTMSGRMMLGDPAAAMRMSACFVYSGRKFEPVWQCVTVAFACSSLSERSTASGRPIVSPRPTIDDVPALDRDVVVREQRLDPERRARARSDRADHQPPEVHRVQAVGVLARIDRVECGLVVEALRQRQLHDERVDVRVVVELVDRAQHVGLGRGLGELDMEGVDPDVGRVGALAADVRRAVRVVADEDRPEAGRDPTLTEHLDARPQVRP